MNNFIFLGIEAALVAALPVAIIARYLLAKYYKQHTRRFLVGLVGFLFVIAIAGRFGISMRWLEADIVVLFAASVAYSSLFILAFYVSAIALRVLAVIALGIPIVLGYFVGTVGILALLFMSGDLGSSVELHTKPGFLCRAEPFGNATTDVNGYFVRLLRPIGFLEKEVYEARFVDPITPEEACFRASAAYGS